MLVGKATVADRRVITDFYRSNPDLITRWRKAASRRRLDYGRPWEQGYAVLYPEFAGLKGATRWLMASAKLGLQPRENLLTVARLSALTRQEPEIIAQFVGLSIGKAALKQSANLGISREVEAALGPPMNVRWVWGSELPFMMEMLRLVGTPRWSPTMGVPEDGFLEKLRHAGPWKANASFRLVRAWRRLWRDLPKDGTDYAGAIKAIDRHMPAINKQFAEVSPVIASLMGDPDDVTEPIESFQKFERERERVASERRYNIRS